jgi:pimeloyl-ACP methyl ester carboxylesterase
MFAWQGFLGFLCLVVNNAPLKLEIPQEKGKLIAALDLPEGKGPFPVIVIEPGSGPTDKDGNSGNLLKSECYKMLGTALAKQGIAVIRIDKRGIAESAAALVDIKKLTLDDYSRDVAAWVQLARKDERFSKVFYIGHSEGSMVGARPAMNEKLDGFISLCGPGKNIGDTLRDQLKPKLTAELYDQSVKVLETLESGKETDDFPKELASLFNKGVQPYLITMLKVNPTEDFGKLTCPSLILCGNKDIQVDEEHGKLLEKANSKAKRIVIDGMTHTLKKLPSPDATMKPYLDPSLPLADGLVDAIVKFVKG